MTSVNWWTPIVKLPTNRGLLKFLIFNILTLGIYSIVVYAKISSEVNLVISSRDGRHTMNYLWIYFLWSWLTFGIAPYVWYHRICNRIGDELRYRGLNYDFDASTFWLWSVLGSFIFVGPFIFLYKFMKAMNLLNADYNNRG